MDNIFFNSYRIEDRSLISFIKREIHNLVINAGFTAHKTGEVDIVFSEITSNLIKYAGSGEILHRLASDNKGVFLELICLDNGPGIANLNRMMIDGNSSSTSLGQGLGAIKRLSNTFSIYTAPRWGCLQYLRIYKELQEEERILQPDLGTMQVCAPGEQVCGDGYFVKKVNGGLQFFLGDGLGHGQKANEAVNEAILAFKNSNEKSPVEIIKSIHSEVKKQGAW